MIRRLTAGVPTRALWLLCALLAGFRAPGRQRALGGLDGALRLGGAQLGHAAQ